MAQGDEDTAAAHLKMYGDLASWFPLLSAPHHYEEESGFWMRTLNAASSRPLRTLLELGSGGGHNASYMKAGLEIVLADRSPAMLEISRRLNPECEHVLGDMRSLRLGRSFDAVFVHDAVCYLTSEADLRRAMETAHVHCRPGGVVLFAPDYVRENFKSTTNHGGDDGDSADRSMRYLEWCWDPDPSDSTYIVDYAFLLRERDGSVRVEHDRHLEGLFSRADWLRLLAEVGFEARLVAVEIEPGQEAFVGVRGV